MHHASLPADTALARSGDTRGARSGDAVALASALSASRADTLATFAVFEQALPSLRVPQRPTLNPPLWELGHIGWFQERWTTRVDEAERARGDRADPNAPLAPPQRAEADALYDSSRVPHAARWSLPLPDAGATRDHLAAQLEATLAALRHAGHGDDALYAFRLVLLHEDMHHEAALYMAQALGIPIDDPRWQPRSLPDPPAPLTLAAGRWRLGRDEDEGFAFDNERGAHEVDLATTTIDAQVVRWAEFLPFVEAGGYDDRRWWSDAGWRWCREREASGPSVLRRAAVAGTVGWQRWRGGRWKPLDAAQAACHLSAHEAEAWCRWAGRRLPTEAEWERAARQRPAEFRWGEVWEWTASPFAPYPGFRPHPYRDYSAPWFDGRPVLRGASFMTQPRLADPRYRNFFPADRHDVPAGFRSCAR